MSGLDTPLIIQICVELCTFFTVIASRLSVHIDNNINIMYLKLCNIMDLVISDFLFLTISNGCHYILTFVEYSTQFFLYFWILRLFPSVYVS